MTAKVRWPGKAYAEEADDLSMPIRDLLENLRILEDQSQKVSLIGGTPEGLQVITAGTTSLTKWWTGAVAAFGGSAALVTGLKGWLAHDSASMSSFVLTASGAVLGAAVAIAIALITKADLQSRATASAAQYQARAAVTSAVLNNLQFSRPVAPSASAPSSETRYLIKRASDNHWYAVRKFTWSPTGIVAVVQGGLTIASDEIEAFMPSTDWS